MENINNMRNRNNQVKMLLENSLIPACSLVYSSLFMLPCVACLLLVSKNVIHLCGSQRESSCTASYVYIQPCDLIPFFLHKQSMQRFFSFCSKPIFLLNFIFTPPNSSKTLVHVSLIHTWQQLN
jgi:hypothetical protein